MARHSTVDKAIVHSIISELETRIDSLYLEAIRIELSQGNSDTAEGYRLAARSLQSRVNALVYDFGRPPLDTFRVESVTAKESTPPVDLFTALRAAVSTDATQFVSPVGKATQ